jgi:hypothetical protein
MLAAMPKRRAPYSTREQTVMDYDAPALAPIKTVSSEVEEERSGPEYTIKTGWVDTAGKTRTWILCEPSGVELAAITTRSGAKKLADLLNRAESNERER